MTAAAAAPAQYVENFIFQSYFDYTKLETALLDSPPNSSITPSTQKNADTSGYGVALDPASETPVAVEFLSPLAGSSGALIVKPGQTLRPGFHFSGFRWGLPKGWLGGGLAILNVLRTPNADLRYVGAARPVIFHRAALVIEADGAVLPALRRNWPSRFPWTQAVRDLVVPQGSGPVVSVRPERVVCRLRYSSAAAPVTLRFVFRGSFDLDAASNGVLGTTDIDSVWYDVTFPLNVGAAGGYSLVELPREFAGLACDEGGVTVLNISGIPALTGAYLDVVRYGSLG